MNYKTSDEHTELKVALCLGLATEYLVMSALASLDVSLLADDKSPYSKLALSRANVGTSLDIKQLRTVTYGAAMKLLWQHKQFISQDNVRAVMNTRNAAAHMAMATQKENGDGLTAMLTVVSSLHKYLTAFSEADYWGVDCLPVVQNLLNEQASRVEAQYNRQVLEAKGRFRALSEGVASTELEHVYTSLEARLVQEAEEWDASVRVPEVRSCPACMRAGRITWTRFLLDDFEQVETYESAMGNDAPAVSVNVERVAVAFKCLVCSLELERSGVTVLLGGDSSYLEEERYLLSQEEMASYYERLQEYEPDDSDLFDSEVFRRF